jgi:phage tail sheath gpL-like
MAISDAVGLERISRIVGYKLTKGDFSESSPNLPQSIAVLTEMNTANQSTALTPTRITSAQQAGTLYGFGSPAHIQARILFPVNGGGAIGGIPVWFYPQVEAGGATAKTHTITATGTATAGGTHYVVIGGRYSVDGGSYAINILTGDTATTVALKISDIINNVLGCPVTAAVASPASGVVTTTSKWKGLTANGINIRIDTGNNTLGMSYVVSSTQDGTGTPTITTALGLFGNTWHTQVLNSYGFQSTTISALESFNGMPDPVNPTGRYAGIIFKPFIALTGTVEDSNTGTTDVLLTDADKTNVTIAACPAPGSEGLAMEAAANMCTLFARISQDTPQLDVEGLSYPDMPISVTTPITASYEVRDAIVKMGMSTVDIVSGAYQVQDFVTTYHPIGEIPPQFRYCRNLMLDFNVRFGYYLLEQTYVVSHMIAADDDVVSASKVIKPKQWKAIVSEYAVDLATRGLIADTKFMQSSIVVGISTINPDRLETFFRYKRTGVARISSTTAEAGFNFGTV